MVRFSAKRLTAGNYSYRKQVSHKGNLLPLTSGTQSPMKLCRFGPKGHEKPGLIDGSGALRSLAGHRPDLTTADLTDAGLAELRGIDPTSLPLVQGEVR